MKKIQIDIEDVRELMEARARINRVDVGDIDFWFEGKRVTIPQEEADEWDFTGLNSVDFIMMRDWETQAMMYQCEDCGGFAQEERECPYNEEMGGMSHMVWLCNTCYSDRAYAV
jgi:hypothetical protein